MTVSGPSMQHLSCVTGLQVLRLGSHMVGLAALTALQNRQQLTQLQMHVGGEGLSTSTLPAGLCPDTVKHLQLSTAGLFDPALLAPLQQVHDIRLTLRQQGSGSASPALLEQLGKLTQLTSLELCCVFDAAQWSGTAAALLSALTASSNLQELTLDCGRGDRVLSLQDIWPHAFPEQLRMPGLRNLTVRDAAGWEAAPAAMDDDDGKPGVAWPEQCLTHLVSCCPGMHSLDALSISQHVGHLVPLRNVLQLSLLTALTVVGISDTEAHEVAVGLPCLQNLQVGLHSVPGCITATGLSQLSALQLTHLGLTGREAFFFGNIETDDFWDEEEEAAFKAYVPYTVQDSTLASVALLTSLQELHLRDHMNITDAGLLQLSALRQLTRLDVNDAMGLLGYHTEGIWVYLPTEACRHGMFCGKPVWPELLGRILRSHNPSARQLAHQAVLANRQALLEVLGPQLAADLPHMRFHRTMQQLVAEVDGYEEPCDWMSSEWSDMDEPDTQSTDGADVDEGKTQGTDGAGAYAARDGDGGAARRAQS